MDHGEVRERTFERYGDREAGRGAAFWALWSIDAGTTLPQRYPSWEAAEAARAGSESFLTCLHYAWGVGD